MALDTLREISIQLSLTQFKQVDHITEEAPFLALMPFGAATHDLWHNVNSLRATDAIGMVAIGAPLPAVTSEAKLNKIDLAKMGGIIEVGEDLARQYGGKDKYFADKSAPILKKTGMNTEHALYYDNLRAYAIDHYVGMGRKGVYDAGGSGSTNHSILAVRFEEGVC